MIIGMFNGTSLASLKNDKAKLATLAEKLAVRKSQAIADRTAAINELKPELDELAGI